MEKVTLTFIDGSTLEAERNGSCFVTETKPELPEDLSRIEVSDGEIYEDCDFIECASPDNNYYFSFIKKPENSLDKLQAQIEYIALMTDIELEE